MKNLILLVLFVSSSASALMLGQFETRNGIAHPQLTFFEAYSGIDSSELTAIQAKIASTAAECAALPMQGTVYYYCDCGTGADAGCVAGNDANDGLSAAHPRQTIADAVTRFAAMSANNTVALCKGGAFNASATFTIPASKCAAGSTCADLREYAVSGQTAKPIINFAGTTKAVTADGNKGGARLLNISLKGSLENQGAFFYDGAHDVKMCNLDMSNFNLAVYVNTQSGKAIPNKISFTGNTITNVTVFGYLGGGSNSELSYNTWDGVGNDTSMDHTIYLVSALEVANMSVVGNYINGQIGSVCSGAPLEGHGAFDGIQIKNNYINIAASAARGGCWGIELDNGTGNSDPTWFKSMVVSGNTIVNGGNTAIVISSAPGVIVENNVIIQNWAYSGLYGINVTHLANRGQDLTSNANVIRNNTIWFGPNATGNGIGIWTNTEGTGHIVSNNTITSTQTGGLLMCFKHDLALTSYAFLDNNHCYSSTVSAIWEWTHGATLSAWQSYTASYGFDANSVTGAPLFTDPSTNDFSTQSGSPLRSAGDTTNKSIHGFTGNPRPVSPTAPDIGAYQH
jgi:hypothetical protein